MALRVVFIGAGGRGRSWIPKVQEVEGFEPVAIVDPSEAAHRRVADDHGELHLPAFTSVEDAAEHVEADLAINSAISWTRKETCVAALEAGWHLLIEKPFALSFEEAREIVDAGRRAGRIVSAAQNYRFIPAVATMQRMVAEGELGRLGHGVFVRHRKRYAGNTYQKDMRHNYLWEMAVHDLDLIRFTLCAKPLKVSGASFLPPWGDFSGETSVSAVFEFENGIKVNYFGAWASHIPEFHWRIDGSGGSLRYGDGLCYGQPEEKVWRTVENLGDFGGDHALLREIAVAIRDGGDTSTSGVDNLWTVGMMQGVVMSTEAQGRQVSIADLVEGGSP